MEQWSFKYNYFHMIQKANIERIVKHIVRRRRGVHDHQIIHPARDWFIGVGLSLSVVIGVAYWSAMTYLMVSNRSVEADVASTPEVTVYRTELVQAALNKFGNRATTYEELLSTRTLPTPPVEQTPTTETEIPTTPLIEASTTSEPELIEESATDTLETESLQAF